MGWALMGVLAAAMPAAAGEGLLGKCLAGPMGGAEEVVFAVRQPGQDPHWYANFAYWSLDPARKLYGPGGARLCKLNLRTKKLTVLVDDPAGSIRDPHVHYDGAKVLFSYRKGGTGNFHLYELALDPNAPTRLRQITSGPFDDIEPAYLPNLPGRQAGGDIIFCSARCKRWVQCWYTQVAVLYRCDADGGNIRAISSNVEHDNTPAVLPDGRILYTRWEYVDRSQVEFHHLWTVNPDGTGQMAYFGNMLPGNLFIDARPIPGSDRVAVIFSPGHGSNEHKGRLMVVSPDAGPDVPAAAHKVNGCPDWVRDPYPFSEDCFLIARRHELLLVDASAGRNEVVYSLDEADRKAKLELHEPRAIRPRPKEPIVADRADLTRAAGTLVLANITHGRRMEGVRPGLIKKLLVLETLPKPINFSGGPEPLSFLGTFTLERVMGTVPVEPDGSAHIELPAHRPVFFVALDANDMSVKRMQSFVSVMPGETTGCVGCHEQRNETARFNGNLAALKRPPSPVEPFADYPDVIDFPRDIQPILDEHCLKCHDFSKRSGGVVLAGDRGVWYSLSYWSLVTHGQVVDGRNGYANRPPRAMGSSASPLMDKISGRHHKVKLSPRQWRTVWLWVESGATYSGTYAALGSGMVWSEVWGVAGDVLQKRCYSCHCPPRDDLQYPKGKTALPAERFPRPRGGAVYERFHGTNDDIARRSAHALTNLTRPELSPLLLAPLAKKAGGWEACKSAVFETTDDAGYQKMLACIRRTAQSLEEIKRFDMPGFRPNEHYLREMKRYGVLPPSFDAAKDPIDVYNVDRAYWKSLWYVPAR